MFQNNGTGAADLEYTIANTMITASRSVSFEESVNVTGTNVMSITDGDGTLNIYFYLTDKALTADTIQNLIDKGFGINYGEARRTNIYWILPGLGTTFSSGTNPDGKTITYTKENDTEATATVTQFGEGGLYIATSF